MTAVVVALSVETIPIGVIVGAALDRSLRRRSRFWLRFTAIVVAIVLPELVAVVVPVDEQTLVTLILLGLGGGSCCSFRRGLCSSMGGVSTRDPATMTVTDRALRTGAPGRRRQSEGSHFPTQNRHRPVFATIARRGGQRVRVGPPASGSVPRYIISGRCGCGRRSVSARRTGFTWSLVVRLVRR